jgi:hypothetical protein
VLSKNSWGRILGICESSRLTHRPFRVSKCVETGRNSAPHPPLLASKKFASNYGFTISQHPYRQLAICCKYCSSTFRSAIKVTRLLQYYGESAEVKGGNGVMDTQTLTELSPPQPHGIKRHADDELDNDQRLTKRFNLLNLGTPLHCP